MKHTLAKIKDFDSPSCGEKLARKAMPGFYLQQGFTLIEVLVALVIIAIACFAVLHVVSSSISMQKRLEDHQVGTWISNNVLVDLRTGAIQFNESTNAINNSTKMLYQMWPWQARLISQDSFIGHYDHPVGVSVKNPLPPNQTIWRLQGYIPLDKVPND